MSDLEDIIELDSVIAAEKALKKESAHEDDLYYPSEFEESFEEESEDETENEAQNLSLDVLSENISPVKTELVVPQTDCEQTIIDNCTQPDLKQVLTLNRMKYNTLISLYNKIVTLIENCQEKLAIEGNRLRSIFDKKKITKFHVTAKLGYPYFKDEKYYCSPSNSDVQLKQKRNEITLPHFMFTYCGNNWDANDKATLLSSVKLCYYSVRQSELVNKMNALKSKCESEKCKDELDEKLSELKKQLNDLQVNGSEEVPDLYKDFDIDWKKISSIYLADKHSPTECKAYWNIFLHPSINKSPWKAEENKKLISLVKSYDKQNWDEIASQLNTNRTGFSCCVYYFTNLSNKFKRTKFLPSEDDYLLDIIEYCRVGDYIPWNKIAYYFQDRSRIQLYHRYKYYLTTNSRKGLLFTIAEDLLILCLMKKFKNISKCAKYIPNRSYMQVKSRYINYLQNLQLNYGSWSADEDERLMAHVKKLGTKRWSIISKELNRTGSTCRQRYLTLTRKISKNPDVFPETKPFKNISYLNKLRQRYNLLRVLYDKFKNFDGILTLEHINNSKHLRNYNLKKKIGLKDNVLVDQQLMDYFETYSDDKSEIAQTVSVQHNIDSLNNALNALGADLNIPDRSELEENKQLDETDVKILLELKEKMKHAEDSSKKYQSFLSLPGTSQSNLPEMKVKALIPPNLDSLCGLKHILLNHKKYKDQVDSTDLKDEHIESKLMKFDDENTRTQIHFERKLFEYRFDSIFKWPCIMSLLEPSNQLKSKYLAETQSSQKAAPAPKPEVKEKRKRGRPRKKGNTKVLRMVQLKHASKSKCNSSKDDGVEVIDLSEHNNSTVKTENVNAEIPEELTDIEKLNSVITLENTLEKEKLKVNNKRKTKNEDKTHSKRKRIENIHGNSQDKTRGVEDFEESDLKLDIEKLNMVLKH